jgi:hypothetical protein
MLSTSEDIDLRLSAVKIPDWRLVHYTDCD